MAELTPEDKNLIPGKNNYKPVLFGVLGLVILGLVAWGLLGLSKYTRNKTDGQNPAPKQVNLTQEQRDALQGQALEAEDAIKKLPPDATADAKFNAYRKLAGAKYLLGLYDEALAALDKVSAENQNNSAMWSLYTNIYRDKGDLDKAKESAKKALDLDKTVPEFWLAYINLSSNENSNTIRDLYKQALDNTAGSIGIVTSYADFLEKTGDKQGAIEQWKKAIEIFPQGKADYDAKIQALQK